jgi:ADP-L-glycero-D-manno-heptose 6-epimerase
MIVVTGAAGFIGSVIIKYLQDTNLKPIIAVDDFGRMDKNRNLKNKEIRAFIHRDNFPSWLESNFKEVEFIFHMGARTDTTDPNEARFDRLNFHYSQDIWKLCTKFEIPLIYASSAATYGGGEFGFVDSIRNINALKPLNQYGWSKQKFDLWVVRQKDHPPHWYGFKFFNIYGPNEYHKDRMASVVFHAFNQIKKNGCLKLFRSHHADYKDGQQSRDFIYVKDVAKTLMWFYHNIPANGIYNLGTGKARPFLDLAKGVFKSLGLEENITFIDTPADIREKYQYFTEADIAKLNSLDFDIRFESLESGIHDYVTNYLLPAAYL